ncbi:LysR family transcriptional regulator [Amycolatopsis sp.]|uniref:LysR family transcriptional regulator n=1 Tax=Amycolatopsis sp. TaxID=37632 RepID=UPI002B98ACA5|nr:LysR family transcriptional regulator [Amycolatopsis sp.]HVV11370.1 LysR family transcriptional regulator [Amycolatopsis sp.]
MLHLRYFVAVARELNFGRAAARLHLSASPLSQRVKDLERELGRALFVRSHHKVELTEAGETLLPLAREIVERFDAVPALVRDGAAARSRTVVLGIAPEVSSRLRDHVLGALAKAHPDVAVRLDPAPGTALSRSLQTGVLDLALLTEPAPTRGLGTVRLECRPVGAVVALGTGFDDRTSVRLEELLHLPYAPMGFEAGRAVEEELSRIGVSRCPGAEGLDAAALAHVVATGQAFTVIACGPSASRKAFTGEPVTVIPVEEPGSWVTTVAAWRRDRLRPEGILAGLAGTLRGLRPLGRGHPYYLPLGHRTAKLG